MNALERQVRDSLHTRAADVETTPALWERVSSQVERHAASRRWLAALSGAAAVLVVALVVVPTVRDAFQPSPDIDVAPGPPEVLQTEEESTLPDTVPSRYAAADGNDLSLRAAANVAVGRVPDLSLGDDVEVEAVAVRPGSTAASSTVAATVRRAADDTYEVVVVRIDGDVVRVEDVAIASFDGTDGIVPPRPVWSADGGWLAWIETGDNTGVRFANLQLAAVGDDEVGDPGGVSIGDGEVGEAAGELALADWTGDTSTAGGQSTITYTTSDGGLRAVELEADAGGTLQGVGETETSAAVADDRFFVDFADSHLEQGSGFGGPSYALVRDDGSYRIHYSESGLEPDARLAFPEELADAEPEELFMSARGDGVLVGSSELERVWLLVHDGAGNTELVRELESGATDVDLYPLDTDQEQEPAESSEPPEEPGAEAPVPGSETSVVVTGAEDRSRLEVVDLGSGETTEILDMPGEGESFVQTIAVRPGSTPEDATVAFLAQGEGMYDIRYVNVADGEPGELRYLPDELQPATPGNPDEVSVPAPVWSPDGDSLAYVETIGEGDSQQLRVIGWDGDGPSDDSNVRNTSFNLSEIGVDRTVQAQDWVAATDDADDATGSLWLTGTEQEGSALIEVPLAEQGDGAIALDGDAFVLGTDIARVEVAHRDAGRNPRDSGQVHVDWVPGEVANLVLVDEDETVKLPGAYEQAIADDERFWVRPWLATSSDELLTGIAGAVYRWTADGGVEEVELEVGYLDLVD